MDKQPKNLGETAEKIADLAGVPAGLRHTDVPAHQRRREFVLAIRDLIGEVAERGLARLAAPAYSNVDNLNEARTKLIAARDALRRLSGLVDTAPIDELVAALSILLGVDPEPVVTRRRGRRPGSYGDWLFAWLVLRLLSIIRSADAVELTLSKSDDNKPRGTLVDALNLLRSHLPIIPAELPYKTLERLRAIRAPTGTFAALDLLRRLLPPPPFTPLRQ
jgi:hypothetical protein